MQNAYKKHAFCKDIFFQPTATYMLHTAADTDTGYWHEAIAVRLGCVLGAFVFRLSCYVERAFE